MAAWTVAASAMEPRTILRSGAGSSPRLWQIATTSRAPASGKARSAPRTFRPTLPVAPVTSSLIDPPSCGRSGPVLGMNNIC